MKIFKLLVCLIALSAVPNLRAQQITGSMRGTVTDPSGAVVEGATVTARQNETGLSRITTTDHAGTYLLLELPVGHYQLLVERTGFQSYIQQGISLDVNESAIISVALKVGAESEKIQVDADAEIIQATVTSLGTVVSEREVLDLPLNGRNFTQLGLLQPGVVPLTPGLAEAGGSLRASQAYAVNGQRPESNNFLIDGANNFNGVDGGFVLKPPVDAVPNSASSPITPTPNSATVSGLPPTSSPVPAPTRSTAPSGSFSATTFSMPPTTSLRPPSRSSKINSALLSAGRSAKTRPSSSASTKASATARAKRNLPPFPPSPSVQETSLPRVPRASPAASATIPITSCSTSSSTSPIPTTSSPISTLYLLAS